MLSLPAGATAGLAAAPVPDQRRDLSTSWKSIYLHGEAWASESLPVGAVAKVGVARAYMVLGVAVAPAEHHAGAAWGVGLGTAGRARGRFTPSLDLVQWFLGHDGDEGAGPTYLTQLRPQLAWQLRREGRWALVLGPTFNLATADSHGTQHGNFGHNQWLWVDGGNERSSVRFWPGVQVGLRF